MKNTINTENSIIDDLIAHTKKLVVPLFLKYLSKRIPNRNHSTINRALSPMLASNAVLCSDAHPAYRALSKAQGVEHFIVRSKPGQNTMSVSYHIQNVNSLHSRFKDFLRPFRGPASKNLAGYIQWFLARIGDVSSAEAYQRLLL